MDSGIAMEEWTASAVAGLATSTFSNLLYIVRASQPWRNLCSKLQKHPHALYTIARTESSFEYATLGASSKLVAIFVTYPVQVIQSRLQQRPDGYGQPRYIDSWHVVRQTVLFEGMRGSYKGITANMVKNAPTASLTSVVYQHVFNILKLARATQDND